MPRYIAQVKPDARFNPITACSGITFTKADWIFIPDSMVDEAESNPYLNVKEFVEADFLPKEDEPVFEEEPLFEEEPELVEVNASEAAITYAHDHGIDLSEITGTGKDGKIILSDVKVD